MQHFTMGSAALTTLQIGRESFLSLLAHIVMAGVVVIALTSAFSLLFFDGWSIMSVISSQGSGLFDGPMSQLTIIAFSLLVALILIAMQMSIFRSTASEEDIEFPQAFLYGYGASLPVFLALLLFYLMIAVPLVLLIAFLGGSVATQFSYNVYTGESSGSFIAIPVVILFLVAILFIYTRLGLAGPIMAAKGSFNPFAAIKEAWALTRGITVKLMAYFFLVNILALIAYVILTLMVGWLTVSIGYAASVLSYAVYGLYLMISALIPVGVYRSIDGWQGAVDLEEAFS